MCVDEERGIGGENMVYLDITPEKSGQDAKILEQKLGGVFEIYRKFVGTDPIKEPMKIFPGMHYSMGGLWVSPKDEGDQVMQMTNVPGVFAAGEVEFQYHGANRLGANSLLSCIFGGFIAGPRMVEWVKSNSEEAAQSVYDSELKRQEEINDKILGMTSGDDNTFKIHKELGDQMTRRCTVVRRNPELQSLLDNIGELEERWERVNINDDESQVNQSFGFARATYDMLQLAKAVAKGALMRNECRGAHYKPEFDLEKPEKEHLGNATDTEVYQTFIADLAKTNETQYNVAAKNGAQVSPQFTEYMEKWIEREKNWNKTTMAKHVGGGEEPEITYRPVAMNGEPPKPRIYK
jgi:succinate dehydrogenase / fumarate reductase flavoprotein subunit